MFIFHAKNSWYWVNLVLPDSFPVKLEFQIKSSIIALAQSSDQFEQFYDNGIIG
jgi:hypothetical protein